MGHSFLTPSCGSCRICDLSLFSGLDEKSLNELSKNKSDNIYKKGQIIFNESNHPSGVYAIYNGKVKIYKQGNSGKEQILQLAGPGGVLGYRAIICNDRFNVSAATLEETILCFIPKEFFLSLLHESVRLSKNVMEMLSKDLGTTQDKTINLTQKPVKARIAEAILNLYSYYGSNAEEGHLNVELSRTNLSNIAGTTLESTVRALNTLKKENIIQVVGKKITVLNIDVLSESAGIFA